MHKYIPLQPITADTSVARLDNLFSLQIKKINENLWSWRVSLVWMELAIFGWGWHYFAGPPQEWREEWNFRDLAKQEQSKAGVCSTWRSAEFCHWCHCRAAGELQNCAPMVLLSSLQTQGALCSGQVEIPEPQCKYFHHSVQKTSLACRMGSNSCLVIWAEVRHAKHVHGFV